MNYKEAEEYLLTVRWKTSSCFQEDCWCKVIEPEEKIEDDHGNEIYIASAGSIPKIYAEHIVKLHNDSLQK